MDPRDWIAVAATVISVASVGISWTIARLNARSSIRPVVIFAYDHDKGWQVSNIGAGPALNIIIAQRQQQGWFNPVRIPPISKDGSFTLIWCLHDNVHGLGALYEDADGRRYTSICGNDLSRSFRGHSFGPWPEADIGKHWAGGKRA
jgi:hypothetical protein